MFGSGLIGISVVAGMAVWLRTLHVGFFPATHLAFSVSRATEPFLFWLMAGAFFLLVLLLACEVYSGFSKGD